MPEGRLVLSAGSNTEFEFGGSLRTLLVENNNISDTVLVSTKPGITNQTTLTNENSKSIRTNGNWGLLKEDTEGRLKPIRKMILYSATALTIDFSWTTWEDFGERK